MHFCLDGANKMYSLNGFSIHYEWSILGSNMPVDCLCVLGINYLGSGQSPRKIESSILKLKAAVKETNQYSPPNRAK